MSRRRAGIRLLCALSLPMLWTAAQAQEVPVDLELVLAIDVSESIDANEARLQREGYIAALSNPEVMEAITSGSLRRIALTYFEWGEATHQRTLVEWTLIENREGLQQVAQSLAEASYAPARWTSISGAIDYGVRRIESNGFAGTRRAIDISGDGSNNHGRDVVQARDEAVAKGITVNGLPIIGERLSKYGWPRSADVDYYYENTVIGGPGAFIIPAEGPGSFAEAILRKLVKEIAAQPAHIRLAGARVEE